MSDPRGDTHRALFLDLWGVFRLALTMVQKLRANRHKAHWLTWEPDSIGDEWLMDRIEDELTELRMAHGSGTIEDVMSEAADIANFAMMVHERARRWDRPTPTPEPKP